ncbi:ABC transporter ATP-binding protein [Pseudohoeflea coraliihabitans]|uniref:ABC transporter ATP-binding protein n=1 Tax=Pseudohoeflea coraliihabitans TaxID=2860393 RepID=A0ABS6WKD2_9HYPH|nr:ABC transporter ATP-binding protein [Pseudohoeflea sp. DP4N28-3]MBW3096412.1 ABC transporter ATP-binding protein [Pseudohoeflea sp. DP4N28-3]
MSAVAEKAPEQAAATPSLAVRGLVKSFGGLIASDHIDLTVRPGEIHALIGPNGAGKTTLISQLMGELTPDAGTIEVEGQSIDALSTASRVERGLARTFQITCLLPDYTVRDNVAVAVQVRQGHSFRFWKPVAKDEALRRQAETYLAATGLAERADELVANLSHGEQKQLELAVALATEPRLLLLDEPMAGLGHAESLQMIEMLRGLKNQVSMLLVEHDMDAVFALADRISVLVYGRIIASGTVDEIRDDPDVRTAYLGEGDAGC